MEQIIENALTEREAAAKEPASAPLWPRIKVFEDEKNVSNGIVDLGEEDFRKVLKDQDLAPPDWKKLGCVYFRFAIYSDPNGEERIRFLWWSEPILRWQFGSGRLPILNQKKKRVV